MEKLSTEEAFESMSERIRDAAQKISKNCKHFTEEDLYQDGCEAFLKLYPKYNPDQGSLVNFMFWAVYRDMVKKYQQYDDPIYYPLHLSQRKCRPKNTFLSFEDEINVDNWSFNNFNELFDPIDLAITCKPVRLTMKKYITDREYDILCKRFGFDEEPMTLEEIGKERNLTRERVRAIEARALQKLRTYMIKGGFVYD